MNPMTGYAPNPMLAGINPARSQIAALMGARPGMPPAMPTPQNGIGMGVGQPPMAQPSPRPVMGMPRSMMR